MLGRDRTFLVVSRLKCARGLARSFEQRVPLRRVALNALRQCGVYDAPRIGGPIDAPALRSIRDAGGRNIKELFSSVRDVALACDQRVGGKTHGAAAERLDPPNRKPGT